MVTLLAACFLMSAAHGPLYVFYSIHLVEHGYGNAAVGAFWAVGVVAEIAVFALMPRMMRAWSLRTILAASFALAVVRFLLIGWFADSTLLLLLAQLMHGATFGAYHAAAVAAINRWFSARHQARAQAVYGSVSFGAGGMVGGLVSGQAWESLGPEWTYSIGAAFAAVGLLLVWRGLSAQGEGGDRRPGH
jgi:PPP family 3-phenylpropionic acid transporter